MATLWLHTLTFFQQVDHVLIRSNFCFTDDTLLSRLDNGIRAVTTDDMTTYRDLVLRFLLLGLLGCWLAIFRSGRGCGGPGREED